MIDHDKEDYPRPAGPVGANLDWLLAWLERPTRALGVGTTGSPLESQPGPDPRQIDRLRSAVRFVRSDGSLIFGARVKSKPRLVELERWVRRVGDSELAQVLSGWVPRSSLGNDFTVGPSPLATETWRDRPLAILRTDWTARGDYLAIDHREVGTESTVEVAGRGVSWLGPRWGSPTLAGSDARVEPTFAVSGPFADAYEWSFQVGPARVTRSAILVRVRGPGDLDADRARSIGRDQRGSLVVARRGRGEFRPLVAGLDPPERSRSARRPVGPARSARGELPDRAGKFDGRRSRGRVAASLARPRPNTGAPGRVGQTAAPRLADLDRGREVGGLSVRDRLRGSGGVGRQARRPLDLPEHRVVGAPVGPGTSDEGPAPRCRLHAPRRGPTLDQGERPPTPARSRLRVGLRGQFLVFTLSLRGGWGRIIRVQPISANLPGRIRIAPNDEYRRPFQRDRPSADPPRAVRSRPVPRWAARGDRKRHGGARRPLRHADRRRGKAFATSYPRSCWAGRRWWSAR